VQCLIDDIVSVMCICILYPIIEIMLTENRNIEMLNRIIKFKLTYGNIYQ